MRRELAPAGVKELSVEQLVPGDMMVDGRIQSHVVREVVIPPPKPGVRASFEKLRPRGVWDFAMASLAMSVQLRDQTIEDARVVFGGIAGKPLRETAIEDFLKGKTLSPGLSDQAVAVALANAEPEITKSFVVTDNVLALFRRELDKEKISYTRRTSTRISTGSMERITTWRSKSVT